MSASKYSKRISIKNESFLKQFKKFWAVIVYELDLGAFQMNKSELVGFLNRKKAPKFGMISYDVTYSDFFLLCVSPVWFSVQSSIWAKEWGLHLPSIAMSSSHRWHSHGVFLWRGLHPEGRLQIYYLPERRMEQTPADQLCVQSRWILTSNSCQTTSVSSSSTLWGVFRFLCH